MEPDSLPLATLGRRLGALGYDFTTITPASHARVNARPEARVARTLRDVFGWSRPFERSLLPASMLALLEEAGALEEAEGLLRSGVRFSSLGGVLHAHSAYPTREAEAVFFGPDTYRFVAFVRAHLRPARRLVDVGCGSGAAGLAVADRAESVLLADINARALEFSRTNAALAGRAGVEFALSDVLDGVSGRFGAVLANPPYLVDAGARTYRHGGDDLGTALSVRIAREALDRLTPGGQLLLYTGAPVVEGRDVLLAALTPLLERSGASFSYEELDPDVFGEELDEPAYAGAGVDRIAAVGMFATLPA